MRLISMSPQILTVPGLGTIRCENSPQCGWWATVDGQDVEEGYNGRPKESEQLC